MYLNICFKVLVFNFGSVLQAIVANHFLLRIRYFRYNVCALRKRLVSRDFMLGTLKCDNQLLSWLTSKLLLRTALLWVITQRGSGNSLPTFSGQLIRPETSVRNYHYSLHNNIEERSSYLLRGGSLKSHISYFV